MKILKDKKIKIIIILILVVIFIIAMISSMRKNKEEQSPQDETPTKIELTNELTKELDRKVSLLRYGNYCEIGTNNEYMNGCLYRQNITTAEELNNRYRLYTLVLALDNAMESKINYVVGNIIVGGINFRYTQEFSKQEFEEEYKDLYGEDTINYNELNDMNLFPYIRYDETRKKIFYQTTGEKIEITPNEVIEYINDYESDEQNAYVYVSTAFVSPTGSGSYGIYADYSKQTLVKTIQNASYDKNSIITKENYQSFNTYKYTFTKNEKESLIFKQVELIS
ncbi:MAG: hypothetical protein ACI4XM_03305 [Candidatus Coprovivens sp.]